MECASEAASIPTDALPEEERCTTGSVSEEAPLAIFNEGRRDRRKLLPDKYKKPAAKKANGDAGRRPSRRAIMQLHSETQRLIREAPVNLPYHEPKKVTLMEYLKSRNSVLLRNKSIETKSKPLSKDGIEQPSGEPPAVTTDPATDSAKHPSTAETIALPSFLPRKLSKFRQNSLTTNSSQSNGSSLSPPHTDIGSADAEELPDLNTAWKQFVSGPQEAADGRSVTSVVNQPPPALRQPASQCDSTGSCADDVCYSDVVVVPNKHCPADGTSEPCDVKVLSRIAKPNYAGQLLPVASRQPCPGMSVPSAEQPPAANTKFVTSKDIIRSMIPNLPKLSLPVRKNDTDVIELTNPLESCEMFNRLAKHLKACKADRKEAPMKHSRKDENGLQMFQWHSSDAGLEEKEAAPGALRGALKQALLSRLRVRRRVELRKKEAAYNASKQEKAEASEGDENLDDDFSDTSESDEGEDTENGSQEEDDEVEEDEEASIPRSKNNPFIDGEAAESDCDDDEDEASDCLSDEDRDSDSLRLRLDCESPNEAGSPSAVRARRGRNALRKARLLDDDEDGDMSAPSVPDVSADVCSSSSPRNTRPSVLNTIGPDHGLSGDVSQLLLGQQVSESGQMEEAEPSEDMNLSSTEATRTDHSASFQLDDEGFLRFKSPIKSSIATVSDSRRRLEFKKVVATTSHPDAKRQTALVETSRSGCMDGLLMTAFATNDCLAASEEAAALCSGGFTGIAGSSLGATALISTADTSPANSCPPVDLGARQTSTSPDCMSTDDKDYTHDSSRKRKRVRMAVTEDLSDVDNEEHLSHSSEKEGNAKTKFPSFLGKQRRKIRRDFVEEEAELSGSDDVSSDEEVALDDSAKELLQEIAEADVDDVGTEEDLRNQVGRVHMKSMMDADHKEVLRMQERFLPDGDLHSDSKRIRRFRWRNVDYSSFAEAGNHDNEDGSSAEEEMESEYAWRKERFEREQWLKQNPQDQDPLDSEAFWADMDPQLRRTAQETVLRARAGEFSLKSRSGTAVATKRDGNVDPLPVPGQGSYVNPKIPMRGSFLAKPKEELARLARIYGSISCNPYGAKRNGNFVFKMVPRSATDTDIQANAKKTLSSHAESTKRPHLVGQNSQISGEDSKKPKYPANSILAYL